MNIPFWEGDAQQENFCSQVTWINIGLSMDTKKIYLHAGGAHVWYLDDGCVNV